MDTEDEGEAAFSDNVTQIYRLLVSLLCNQKHVNLIMHVDKKCVY